MQEILKEIGLTKWESQTYLALLELGSTTTGPLVKKSEVPQSKIYNVLDAINKKGLCSYIVKGKTKYFQATEPEILLSILKDKQRKIQEVIPELKALTQRAKNKQSTEILEGMKAITSFFVNLIENSKKQDEWFGFSVGEDDFYEKSQMFYRKIGILRHDSKLNVKIMNNKKYKKEYLEFYQDRWKWIKPILRFSSLVFPSTTVLFKNKIIILDLTPDQESAVVITNKNLFGSYKEFFLKEWEKSKPA